MGAAAVLPPACWSTASGETEGDDEAEDVDDVTEGEAGEEADDVDDEDIVDEDSLAGGKICTISIGAFLSSCCGVFSCLLLGARSGVIVATIVIDSGDGGRTLSAQLAAVVTCSLWDIAVLLLLLLLLFN